MADREKKSRRQKYKNVNISRILDEILDEIKSIFHSF